jgi:non-specific serine/threonine protein kinase
MSPDRERGATPPASGIEAVLGATAASADAVEDALAPGAVLGGYEIEDVAGRGGMGVVYRAREPNLERTVALKVIASRLARDARFRRRFLRESQLAARIEHPNVLPIYRAGEDDGHLFLAMRYVDGTDLGALLRQGALSPADATRLVTDIARALDAAHALGLVHRDVKPANVLLGPAENPSSVYLADFGLTVEADAASELTATGQWIGTPAYVAPEQIRGAGVDARTDVYALGAVLYHCLTGGVPFEATSVPEALAAHLATPPPRPTDRVAALPVGLNDVIARAMSKERSDRYASAGELANAVAAIVRDRGATPPSEAATPVGAPPQTKLTERPKSQLPRPGTALIGREADVGKVVEHLRRDGYRLVTLTGTGGTGKTRLAIEVAARVERELPGGAYFVSLAALRDSALILETVAAALGASNERDERGEEALYARLRDRTALLVLDNLEQLDGADEPVAKLLEACPRLTILATSRAPLRLRAERQLPVQPLDTRGSSPPAVELFIERARAIRPDFSVDQQTNEVISTICARLDGLPLAIELAAARVGVLSPQAMLERIERRLELLSRGPSDLPARQRTLAATIGWSEDLLSDPDREAFHRVSVFPGSWSLAGAEAVIGSPHGDALDTLESLGEKSLIAALPDDAYPERRFTMLETIREYARRRLGDSDQAELARARMAEYHVQLARTAFPALHGPAQSHWVDRLAPELDNIRASRAWAHAVGRDDVLLALAASFWYFLELRGNLTEARSWLRDALEVRRQPSDDRTLALCGACALASIQGDIDATASESAELDASLPLLTDRFARVRALMALGMVAEDRDDLEKARRYFADAAALARGHSDHLAAISLNNLGDAFMRERRLDEARDVLEEALRISREAGNPHGAVIAVLNLAAVQFAGGDVHGAEQRFVDALDAASHRDPLTLVGVVQGLGWCAASTDRLERAALLMACADQAWLEMATRVAGLEAEIDGQARQTVKSSLDPDRLAAARLRGAAMKPLDALEWALGRPLAASPEHN